MSDDLRLIRRSWQSDEYISASQLMLSQTLREFCKESISLSAICGLAVGRTAGILAKSQSLRFLSCYFGTSGNKIAPYRFGASLFAYGIEGIFFHTASEFGRSGELKLGTLEETLHGALTLAICHQIGRRFSLGGVVLQHAAQNSGMVILDLSFERLHLMERREIGLMERWWEAEVISVRMQISATFLARACPRISSIQAKWELEQRVQERKDRKWGFGVRSLEFGVWCLASPTEPIRPMSSIGPIKEIATRLFMVVGSKRGGSKSTDFESAITNRITKSSEGDLKEFSARTQILFSEITRGELQKSIQLATMKATEEYKEEMAEIRRAARRIENFLRSKIDTDFQLVKEGELTPTYRALSSDLERVNNFRQLFDGWNRVVEEKVRPEIGRTAALFLQKSFWNKNKDQLADITLNQEDYERFHEIEAKRIRCQRPPFDPNRENWDQGANIKVYLTSEKGLNSGDTYLLIKFLQEGLNKQGLDPILMNENPREPYLLVTAQSGVGYFVEIIPT